MAVTTLANGVLVTHVTCAECGRTAADFRLLRPGVGEPSDPYLKRTRIEQTGFRQNFTTMRHEERLEEVFAALAAGDFEGACKIHPDIAGFYCHDCSKPYCRNCWEGFHDVWDGGMYDYTEAICPCGHEGIVDD